MQIKKLSLHSNHITQQLSFFQDVLGFDITQSETGILIKVGSSMLEFVDTPVDGKYHYCFLIPCNQITEAQVWLSKKLNLIPLEDSSYIAHFESWNAHSIYFYDGDGNIAELIARHDLQNTSETEFGIHSFLSVNEIGTPTNNPRHLNDLLQNTIGSKYWKGDLDRFSTNGDQLGLFLLPNYTIKKTWFPTVLKVKPLPYSATITHEQKEYMITYGNEIMDVEILK